MEVRRPSLGLLVGLAVVLVVALAGCGGGDDSASGSGAEGGSEEYVAILNGLHDAALADSTYNAVKRAESLEPAEKAVVDAFCYLAWQIGVNAEASKLEKGPYIIGRITQAAEFNLYAPAKIKAAMDELQTVIDLTTLKADLVARYSKACEK